MLCSMADYIHGSTDRREVERLERQASFVEPWWFPHVDVRSGACLLDLGTGIGAVAARLAQRFPSATITGLDRSHAQLSVAAQRHPVARYVEGDAARMPFADASFDHVHATWLLEHVQDPAAVVREVLRVLEPGGVATFLEVDNATFHTTPTFPVVVALLQQLNAAQQRAGGDPFVGTRLGALFEQAGFREVQVRALPMRGTADDPAFFRAFAEEFAEIFESVDEAMPEMRAQIVAACQALRSLPQTEGASMHYTPIMVRAVR